MKKDIEKPLDDLLSLRGKPFSDWKEERKYLREKWGMQGRQVSSDFSEIKKKSKPKSGQTMAQVE